MGNGLHSSLHRTIFFFSSTAMLANPLYFFVLILAAAVGASAQADACVLACVQTALANSTCTSLCVVVLCLNFSISRSCHLHPQYRPRLCLQQYELQTDGGQLPHCQLYRCGSADCPSTSTTRMRQCVFPANSISIILVR